MAEALIKSCQNIYKPRESLLEFQTEKATLCYSSKHPVKSKQKKSQQHMTTKKLDQMRVRRVARDLSFEKILGFQSLHCNRKNVRSSLFWHFWEKYLLRIGSAIRAFWPIGHVNCPTIWTFDSHHFVEVFIY